MAETKDRQNSFWHIKQQMGVRQHEIPGHWIWLYQWEKRLFWVASSFLFFSLQWEEKSPDSSSSLPSSAGRRIKTTRGQVNISKICRKEKSKINKNEQNERKEKKLKFHSKILVFSFFFRHLLLLLLDFCLFRFVHDVTRQRPQNAMPPTDRRLVRISVKELARGKIQKYFHVANWN